MKYSQAAGHFNTLNLAESESQANNQVIFDTIATNSTAFNQDFIQATYEIITNQDQPPSSKFSATLLLLKVTELKNITFMRQLASSKEILNYIFQSAQFDRKKPLDERGQKFFSKKPTQEEKEIGVDYIRLVLEALQYWAITYGSTNRQEPGHIYHLMFTTLSQNITFPGTTLYIEKSQVETDDSHFKQEFNEAHYEEKKEKKEKEQEGIQVEVPTQVKENLAQEHVNAAIISGEEFMKNYKLCILSQSGRYNEDFLKAVNEILSSSKHTPMNKFYALYLLAKMTEFGADELINALIKHHDLLNKLFQNCQIDKSKSVEERGKKIFSKNPSPTDSFFGQCYVNLAIESIYYWGMHYGSKDKKDAKNVFWLMYTTLESVGIKMPKTLEYFETKVDSTVAIIETRLDNSLNRQVKTSRL